MRLIVITADKKKHEFATAFAGTGTNFGPPHDRKYVHTGELYVYALNEDKTEKRIHTFAAGQWKEFYTLED